MRYEIAIRLHFRMTEFMINKIWPVTLNPSLLKSYIFFGCGGQKARFTQKGMENSTEVKLTVNVRAVICSNFEYIRDNDNEYS